MVSSKQSPIVHVGTVRDTRQYLRYHSVSLFEYKDVLLILLFCFALYGLFIYYILPTAGPAGYRQAVNELSYNWQGTWYTMHRTFLQVSSALSQHPVLGEWYQYLFTPW